MKKRRTTMPAWPLHLRRLQERQARRAEQRRIYFAWTSGVISRDVSLVAIVGVVVFFLVWISR